MDEIDFKNIPIGERIKFIRKRYEITQETFAEKTGINRATLANIEVGKFYPSFDTISKILDAYDISLLWLRDGEGQMRNTAITGDLISAFRDLPDDEILEIANFIERETSTKSRKEKLFKYIRKANKK